MSKPFHPAMHIACDYPHCKAPKLATKMFECSRCAGGSVYCSKSCQRADWTVHKPLCTETKEAYDKYSQDVQPFAKLLDRWWKRQVGSLSEIAASALDLVRFPENAGRFDINIVTRFKDASTVEVVDVVFDDLALSTPDDIARIRADLETVRSESSSSILIVCSLTPPSRIPGRRLTGNNTLYPKRRTFSICVQAVHLYHARGLPYENWKALYLAKGNSLEIPRPLCYIEVTGPFPSDVETSIQADKHFIHFAKANMARAKLAFIQRMLATQSSSRDNALVIYVGQILGADSKYEAISCATYSVREVKAIMSASLFDGVDIDQAKFGEGDTTVHAPIILLCKVGPAVAMRLPVIFNQQDVASAAADSAAMEHARDAVAWRASLVLALGGRKPVNRLRERAEKAAHIDDLSLALQRARLGK